MHPSQSNYMKYHCTYSSIVRIRIQIGESVFLLKIVLAELFKISIHKIDICDNLISEEVKVPNTAYFLCAFLDVLFSWFSM